MDKFSNLASAGKYKDLAIYPNKKFKKNLKKLLKNSCKYKWLNLSIIKIGRYNLIKLKVYDLLRYLFILIKKYL